METDFGLYLRNLIQDKGITYTKLEQILSKRTIKRMENGEQQPTLKSLNKIKMGLKLSPEEVLAMHEVAARSKALNILETHHPQAKVPRKRTRRKASYDPMKTKVIKRSRKITCIADAKDLLGSQNQFKSGHTPGPENYQG